MVRRGAIPLDLNAPCRKSRVAGARREPVDVDRTSLVLEQRSNFSVHQRAAGFIAAVSVLVVTASAASAAPTLVKVSHDPYHNSSSQHKTEVEPDTVSFGNTIVSAFQVGRVADAGSADIGWATSLDAGATWTHGYLPGITKAQNPNNRYDAVSDPAVAYDAKHGVWMVATLPLSNTRPNSPAVLISRSSDGIHWVNPVGIAPRTQSADKNWVTCDNTPTSPYFGRCYAEWMARSRHLIMMSKSSDGGAIGRGRSTRPISMRAWRRALVQPMARSSCRRRRRSGSSLSRPATAAIRGAARSTLQPSSGAAIGGIRAAPTVDDVDAGGRIYVAWEDCRFRNNCSANDIVYDVLDGVN